MNNVNKIIWFMIIFLLVTQICIGCEASEEQRTEYVKQKWYTRLATAERRTAYTNINAVFPHDIRFEGRRVWRSNCINDTFLSIYICCLRRQRLKDDYPGGLKAVEVILALENVIEKMNVYDGLKNVDLPLKTKVRVLDSVKYYNNKILFECIVDDVNASDNKKGIALGRFKIRVHSINGSVIKIQPMFIKEQKIVVFDLDKYGISHNYDRHHKRNMNISQAISMIKSWPCSGDRYWENCLKYEYFILLNNIDWDKPKYVEKIIDKLESKSVVYILCYLECRNATDPYFMTKYECLTDDIISLLSSNSVGIRRAAIRLISNSMHWPINLLPLEKILSESNDHHVVSGILHMFHVRRYYPNNIQAIKKHLDDQDEVSRHFARLIINNYKKLE